MLSLRVKFTIYYLAILTVVLLFFGIAIYAYLSHTLLMTVDESLDYQVRKIERNMAAGAGAAGASAAGTGTAGTATDVIQLNSEDEEMLQLAPHITQLIDEEGRITDPGLSEESHQLPVDRAALLEMPVGQTVFESVKLKSGEPLRLATRRSVNHDDGGSGVVKGTYFIRLGQSVKSLAMARRRLLLLLVVALPVALLWGSYGGLVLINQAMRPVDRITRAAEHIGAGDLTERVPVPGMVAGKPEDSKRPKRIDEIGRLAVTFNQMIARLQSAFERQKQFTSDASHELRTPLAVMRGEIEITLRRERPVEEYQRVLTSNLEEIVRLSRLVEDLLMLARVDTGRVELQCEQIDLDALCRQMTDYISPLAEQRHQTLSYETSHQPVLISADSQRLKQLLLNLLDNAIKYTDPGGTIKFSLKIEGGNAVMTITDTGRGIPPEDLPHIFERFFRRSAKTADRTASGFGLGLSIVKWIVDSHGGKIEAQSEVGSGTVFTVKFPLLKS